MIEVSDEWLEQKSQEAMGHAAFKLDAPLDAIHSGGLPGFHKLPPRRRTFVGYHITARVKARRLKVEAEEAVPT